MRMNTTLIKALVRERSGSDPQFYATQDLAGLEEFLFNEDVLQYLQFCLPKVIYGASEVRVLDLESIKAEIAEGAAPGGYIRRFGYLVIASDFGGNAICVHHPTGRVFWVDHE